MAQDNIPPPENAGAPEAGPDGKAEEFPVPEEILDEWRWIHQQRETDLFEPYRGKHVAVYRQQILGASRDPVLLRQYLAEKHHLDPDRLVTFYVENW
jgi:hypothetical protein